MSARRVTHQLEELIAALDRRLPCVEPAGEAAIEREARALRARAIDRLAALAEHRTVTVAIDPGDPV